MWLKYKVYSIFEIGIFFSFKSLSISSSSLGMSTSMAWPSFSYLFRKKIFFWKYLNKILMKRNYLPSCSADTMNVSVDIGRTVHFHNPIDGWKICDKFKLTNVIIFTFSYLLKVPNPLAAINVNKIKFIKRLNWVY